MKKSIYTGPWNIEALMQLPGLEWGSTTEYPAYVLKELYYENEPYQSRPTKVFAYYAVPKGSSGPLPAVVLVHGGAGKAFPEWAGQWAERGYAAIAMDLCGNGPDGTRMKDGGPDQTDDTLFLNLSSATIKDMWEYHAVAAVMRALTITAAQPEVDAEKIGLMGISWGGYTGLIVSALDSRLAYAMIAYGAGYFREGSCWMEVMGRMGEEGQKLWDICFDVGQYIHGSDIPMLWATGTNDICFHLGCWRRTYAGAAGNATLRLIKGWEHNYQVPWGTQEFFAYADSQVRNGNALPAERQTGTDGNRAWIEYDAGSRIRKADFLYTTDHGSWPERFWNCVSASMEQERGRASHILPTSTTAFYFNLEDEEGNIISGDLYILM